MALIWPWQQSKTSGSYVFEPQHDLFPVAWNGKRLGCMPQHSSGMSGIFIRLMFISSTSTIFESETVSLTFNLGKTDSKSRRTSLLFRVISIIAPKISFFARTEPLEVEHIPRIERIEFPIGHVLNRIIDVLKIALENNHVSVLVRVSIRTSHSFLAQSLFSLCAQLRVLFLASIITEYVASGSQKSEGESNVTHWSGSN